MFGENTSTSPHKDGRWCHVGLAKVPSFVTTNTCWRYHEVYPVSKCKKTPWSIVKNIKRDWLSSLVTYVHHHPLHLLRRQAGHKPVMGAWYDGFRNVNMTPATRTNVIDKWFAERLTANIFYRWQGWISNSKIKWNLKWKLQGCWLC